MTSQKRNPLAVLEGARLAIKARSPFLLSSTYALTPVPVPEVATSFITPGLVMGYNPDFMSGLTDDEAGFVFLHEVFHDRLRFFGLLMTLGEKFQEVLNEAQDMVINVMLRDMGWPVFKWASVPAKHGFPEKLSTQEYVDLLLKAPPPKGGSGDGKGGSGKNEGEGKGDGKGSGVCNGNCKAPSKEVQQQLDAEYGRSEAEVRAVERRTAADIQKHLESKKGRGNVPGWMEEWAKIVLGEESRINWRSILSRITLDVHGRIISGGDDFSIRRPSKRSHVRRIIRPGLIEQEVVPIFILDTSGSMNVEMMMHGIRETCSILRQLGIEEAWYMEVDHAVALEPKIVNLSFFQKEITFHGRGGTSFIPAFNAIEKMSSKPDIAFYWTDGDGGAPELPPPNLEVIWGLVPGRYSTRKPARWGHLVVIDDDPTKQQFFEDSEDEEDDEDSEDEEDD